MMQKQFLQYRYFIGMAMGPELELPNAYIHMCESEVSKARFMDAMKAV